MDMLLGILLMACSSIPVREAEDVVSQADSLWHAGKQYGIDEGDSATLAQAYVTLKKYSAFSIPFLAPSPWERVGGEVFSHACYHYGKLLRAKDNPVEAMQAFIAATHSHTRDYHILGRVYSNMGSICHLAGEFQLSYDMYERSANSFLLGGDTTSYYYALNDMAFELAEQEKKEEAIALLAEIASKSTDADLVSLIQETRADAFLRIGQYDSAIYYANLSIRYGNKVPTCTTIKAQAYSGLLESDSAVFYAYTILTDSFSSYQNKFNALYIVSHMDSTLCADEINDLASQREDIRYYEYEPAKEKFDNAIYLLNEDLTRETNLTWFYAIVGTLIFMGISSGLYVVRKRKQHALLSQKVEKLEQDASHIQEKHDNLSARYLAKYQCLEIEIEQACQLMQKNNRIATELEWREYNKMCDIIDRRFYMLATKLKNKNTLKEKEIRLCILVLLDLSRAEISDILPYSIKGIGKLKDHTAKLLGTTGKNLRSYLIHLAIEG